MLKLLSKRSLEFSTEIVQLSLNDSKTTLRGPGAQQVLKCTLSISAKGIKDSPNNILSPHI